MSLYLLVEASQDLTYYLLLAVVIGVNWLVYRNIVYSIFDPAINFVIAFTFSTALVLWMWLKGIIGFDYLASFLACTALFVIGMYLTGRRRRLQWQTQPDPTLPISERQLFTFVLLLTGVISVGLLYGISANALAILSENPVADRVAISAANRWLTVLFFGGAPVGIAACLLYLCLPIRSPMRKALVSVCLLINLLAMASGGAKAALLSVVFVYGAVLVYLRGMGYVAPKPFYVLPYILAILGFGYFIYVTTVPGTTLQTWYDTLLIRLVGNGDTYLYLFVDDGYEALKYTYEPATYLLHTVTTVFGVKFIPYNIGVALYGSSTGIYSGFGPNSHYIGEGMIFWGLPFAPVYAFLIGSLVGWLRHLAFRKKGLLGFVLLITLIFGSATLPLDVTYGEFLILSMLLIVVPIWLITVTIFGRRTRHITSYESIDVSSNLQRRTVFASTTRLNPAAAQNGRSTGDCR